MALLETLSAILLFLMHFFKRPYLRRFPSNASTHSPPTALPLDVLAEIGLFLDGLQDKLSLCLASKNIYSYFLPYLYWSLDVYGTNQCFDCVQFLITHPHLARHVRMLVLHPNYLKMSNKKRLLAEIKLAEEVKKLIPTLHSLKKFIWDGLEIPADDIWVSLRINCPLLKHIGTNLGVKDLSPDNELFSFNNLVGFSLTTELRDSNYRSSLSLGGQPLPEKLWTMLLDRCPHLESLVIGHRGAIHFSRRRLDISPITQARWPRLRSLTMENCSMCRVLSSFEIVDPLRFTDFLRAHPNLKHLHLKDLPFLDICRRPPFILESYGSGLESNPYIIIAGSLQEINLTQEDYSGVFFKYICHFLSFNPNIRKLTLSMNFSRDSSIAEIGDIPSAYDHIVELKKVIACCKRLEDLTVICSTKRKETFFYKEFAEVLRGSSIKRVELWKYHRAGDETPVKLAMRIARETPSIQRIIIRTLHQLWDKEYDPLRILQVGSYKVIRDIQGKARRLGVNEMGGETMAWMLTRKCVLPIDTPQKWRSILREKLGSLSRAKQIKDSGNGQNE